MSTIIDRSVKGYLTSMCWLISMYNIMGIWALSIHASLADKTNY